jgi:hypothetical protein
MSTQQAITDLYTETGVALPSVRRTIVRLDELILALNLTCLEVAGLTRDVASRLLAERGGLQDEDGGERQSPLAGFLYAVGEDASIFVEQGDPVARRRFSVAHELGHYLLHFRPLLTLLSAQAGAPVEALDAFPQTDNESDPDAQPDGQIVLPLSYAEARALPPLAQMEIEANRFAAELLMPAGLVAELAARHGRYFSDDDLVWRLANDLLVSRAAMRWRMRNLGLIGRIPAREP